MRELNTNEMMNVNGASFSDLVDSAVAGATGGFILALFGRGAATKLMITGAMIGVAIDLTERAAARLDSYFGLEKAE